MRKSLNNPFWLMYLRQRFWHLACQFDGIAADSHFVSFSHENVYANALNRVSIRLCSFRR